MLLFTHRDVPGLIGFIGPLWATNVNIAQMNVGREQPGGEAIGVVNLDSVPSPRSALKKFRRHQHEHSVSCQPCLRDSSSLPPGGGSVLKLARLLARPSSEESRCSKNQARDQSRATVTVLVSV